MLDDVASLRLLDAALNRAGEGLRVVEDYVRFVLDDRHLTEQLKSLRHDFAAVAAAAVSRDLRNRVRDVAADVGVAMTLPSESARPDAWSVCTASCERCKQALRSCEEFAKLAAPAVAGQFESLRYRLYTLEAALVRTADAVERLAQVRLYALVDGRGSEADFAALAEDLLVGGVDAIQLRDKSLDDRTLVQRARKLVASRDQAWSRLAASTASATPSPRPLVILNDRPDVAAAVGADGVHLGQNDLSVKDARAIVGPRALIGVSTHSIEQARAAVFAGANYLGVGPTFRSSTKSFESFPGLALVQAVAAEIRLPAFAIGGVNRANVAQVLASGIARIAVSGALVADPSPRTAAAALRRQLNGA